MALVPTDVDTPLAGVALERLRTLTGREDAVFREGQLEAITDLVEDRARVLCVQRTGWGKSAVYFVATALLRERGSGPTLIVSPLLALMRDQLGAARRLGLRAHTINSTNREEWDAIRDELASDTVDLLLVGPERLNNPRFRDELLPLFSDAIGLLVVDEAHCISDWGHDFRPDYRRVRDMLERLGDDVAVLATTATANDRVVEDVLEQLASGRAERLRSYRGPLARQSLRLEVVELTRPAERLAWLAEHLGELEGSGIVYTLTVRDASRVAEWLQRRGISALAYSGEQPTEEREEAERRLRADEVKAVVATSALGMGYDKPDLRWVVHFQAPGSVVAYYQQVGRAGRAVDHADVVLLRGGEDRAIQDFFIDQAFPSAELVGRVLEELDGAGDAGRSSRELQAIVNLGAGRIEALLKVLDVEGAVRRSGSKWAAVADRDWTYDDERYARVTDLRRAEQRAMAALGADGRCLMRALQEELDDPGAEDCGRCAVCAGPRFAAAPDPLLVEEAQRFLRSQPHVFEAKKMAPDASGAMRKIPQDARTEDGLALARIGDGGWWPQIDRDLQAGSVGDELADALARLIRDHAVVAPTWLTWVPSRKLGDGLGELAARVASRLGVDSAAAVERVEDRPAQRAMANAATQAANVRGAFRVVASPPPGPGVLLDDLRGSGWTLAMVGGQLRRAGGGPVVPVALAVAF
ncbi:RecQ family ATP-dependent DNA helicase [Conexibacter sp. SYSU D00693]|uniref:RecQ family ATP-dependent DNA helicase n=1 Tax=Conexibacter sp. SYSU D00693 TaxID=2812560 RepID=UPI00196B2DEE|nr:RecQ family ATP-dependent DNA helicase [Conexibacter sp. SYSU D00693]